MAPSCLHCLFSVVWQGSQLPSRDLWNSEKKLGQVPLFTAIHVCHSQESKCWTEWRNNWRNSNQFCYAYHTSAARPFTPAQTKFLYPSAISPPETLKITNLKNLDSIVFYTESALRVDSKDSEWFFFFKKLHLFLDLIILFRILAPKTLP